MCTQYLNVNTTLFKTVTKSNNGIVGFLEPFDCIIADCSDKVTAIKDFNVITYINLLESSEKHANNILDSRKTLDVCIRLTKCTKNEDERLSVDLDKFTINTESSEDILYDACVPYLNYKRITPIENINLDIANPKGSYVIKVLVRTSKNDKYTVQTLCHLEVK